MAWGVVRTCVSSLCSLGLRGDGSTTEGTASVPGSSGTPPSPPSPPPPTLAGVQIKGQRAPKVPTHTGPRQKQRSQGLCHITELLKAIHTNAPLPEHRARWEQGL